MFDLAPKLTGALTSIRDQGSPFLIDLLRAVIGSDAVEVEVALHSGGGVTFDSGRGRWHIYARARHGHQDPEDTDFIVRETPKGWILSVPESRHDPALGLLEINKR